MLRSGRGGAGNFWTQKEADDALKAKPEDLEAQKNGTSSAPSPPPSTHVADQTPSTSSSAPYTRAGRGGAGNFHDAADVQAAREHEEAAERARVAAQGGSSSGSASAAAATATAARVRIGGRGGVGNWVDPTSELQLDEQKRREELEAKVVLDVESGLAMPPRAYRHQTRD